MVVPDNARSRVRGDDPAAVDERDELALALIDEISQPGVRGVVVLRMQDSELVRARFARSGGANSQTGSRTMQC